MSNNQNPKAFNRLKAVLAEQSKTAKWLASQLGCANNTVSRWCVNKSQPSVKQLNSIAMILDVDILDLLVSTKKPQIYV